MKVDIQRRMKRLDQEWSANDKLSFALVVCAVECLREKYDQNA